MMFLLALCQVDKTHLALEILKKHAKGTYLNYDNLNDRDIIKKWAWRPDTELTTQLKTTLTHL